MHAAAPTAAPRSGMTNLPFALLLVLGLLTIVGATLLWSPARAKLKRPPSATADPDDTAVDADAATDGQT